MARPVTLFSGQWADLPLATLCTKAKAFGFDGLELACWGDHFDATKARDKGYCAERHSLLARHGLKTWAISSHLVGQAVCDNIDSRHKAILPPHVWGNGKPEDAAKVYRLALERLAPGDPRRKLAETRLQKLEGP